MQNKIEGIAIEAGLYKVNDSDVGGCCNLLMALEKWASDRGISANEWRVDSWQR